uniref:DUF7802 domain-containing protein n=1 Tax=Acrobeloides nanus TaxID=290746 RepID=A0A914C0X7_9BILA
MRAPLYIILGIYHMFDYTAYVFVKRLHLPWWAEGPAVGLGAVMLDMPYDIMGIKLLWWTWHDTDPNIYDRMYWVPWNSYYFHASFACSFVWILNFTRKIFVDDVYDWKKFGREFFCAFLAGTLAFWFGSLQFALIYHPAHDIFGVHSEITTCVFLGIYAVIVWIADRHNKRPEARAGNTYWFDELALAVATHYLFYMVLVLVADPVNIVAEGLHQPIGPCNITQKVQTPTGLILEKKKFLCLNDYDEKYFDFHCLPKSHELRYKDGDEPLEWYAACGTKFDNRAEYVFIIWSICILFGTIFFQMAARSGPTPRVFRIVYRSPYRSGDRKKLASEEEELLDDSYKQIERSPNADVRARHVQTGSAKKSTSSPIDRGSEKSQKSAQKKKAS